MEEAVSRGLAGLSLREPPRFRILSANVGPKSGKTSNSYKKTVDLVDDVDPHVIMLQEVRSKVMHKKEVLRKLREHFQAIYKKEEVKNKGTNCLAVMARKDWCKMMEVRESHKRIKHKLVDEHHEVYKLLFKRMLVVRCTPLANPENSGTNQGPVLAVSYHGYHTGMNNRLKYRLWTKACEVFSLLADAFQLPVLIGCDANVKLDEACLWLPSKVVKMWERVQIPVYEPGSRTTSAKRTQGVIDFIGAVCVPNGSHVMLEVEVVKDYCAAVFDHQPLQATVTITTQSCNNPEKKLLWDVPCGEGWAGKRQNPSQRAFPDAQGTDDGVPRWDRHDIMGSDLQLLLMLQSDMIMITGSRLDPLARGDKLQRDFGFSSEGNSKMAKFFSTHLLLYLAEDQSTNMCDLPGEVVRAVRQTGIPKAFGDIAASAKRAVQALKDAQFLPDYGCAIVVTSAPYTAGSENIWVVAADRWEHIVEGCWSGAQRRHGARSDGGFSGYAGSVAGHEWEMFEKELPKAQNKVKALLTDARVRASKTAGFVKACIVAARKRIETTGGKITGNEVISYMGGFPDFATHGKDATSLEWPVAREVVKFLVLREGDKDQSCAFEAAVAFFHLWLAALQAQPSSPLGPLDHDDVDLAMVRLEMAVELGAALAEKPWADMRGFAALAGKVTESLHSAWEAKVKDLQDKSMLPKQGNAAAVATCEDFCLDAPAEQAAPVRQGMDGAWHKARSNVELLPALAGGAKVPTIAKFISQPCVRTDEHETYVGEASRVRQAEAAFFAVAARGFEPSSHGLTLADLPTLDKAVDEYRRLASQLEEKVEEKAKGPLLGVELRGRARLVVWIAFCLTHSVVKAEEKYKLVGSYSVPLNWEDVGHMVLGSKAAQDAAVKVAEYLKSCSERRGGRLFHLSDQAPTMAMADAFAAQDEDMRELMKMEVTDAQARVDAHWMAVQRKQAEVQELEQKLQKEESTLETRRKKLEEVSSKKPKVDTSSDYQEWKSLYNEAKKKVKSAEVRVSAIETELDEANKPPPPVVQPLPKDEAKMRQVLFFLHMKEPLRCLARLSVMAQQMLLPVKWSDKLKDKLNMVEGDTKVSMWADHYTKHLSATSVHTTSTDACTESRIRLRALNAKQPKKIWPKKVEDYRSKADGVWYPDTFELQMVWEGSGDGSDEGQGCTYFNPFRVPRDVVVRANTEVLPEEFEQLNWAMEQGGAEHTPFSRGNEGLARQDLLTELPEEGPASQQLWALRSKPSFLALCGLRAYPATQYRKLLTALADRTLPLGHPAVGVLLRQALYHVGELLVEGGRVRRSWMTDAFEGSPEHSSWAALVQVLKDLAEEVAKKPSEASSLALLGELTSYLAGYNKGAVKVARQLARAAREWAECMGAEVEQKTQEDVLVSLRARKASYHAYAVLCYSNGPLEFEDAQHAITQLACLRQARSSLEAVHLQADDKTKTQAEAKQLKEQVEVLEVQALVAMAGRVADVLSAAGRHLDELATAALRAVFTQAPHALQWGWLHTGSDPTTCVEAEHDGNLYSLNLATGMALRNGLPPSMLPAEVRDHRLYQRVFQARNFEVAQAGVDGWFETVKPIAGCLVYRFRRVGEELHVEEVELGRKGASVLRLLDPGQDEECAWCPTTTLPERLRRMHAHWLSADGGALVLRRCGEDVDCFDRSVEFLGVVQGANGGNRAGGGSRPCCLYAVPQHLRGKQWRELLGLAGTLSGLCDRLVPTGLGALRVLERLERWQFIHTIVRIVSQEGNERVVFHLPRSGLEFWLCDDGSLQSRSHTAHRLASCQQLEQLVGFRQYLVLEAVPAESAERIVLMPSGSVQGRGDSTVLLLSKKCDEWVHMQRFDEHARFGWLRAASDTGQLQLAALFAATGTRLPDKSTGQTGADAALALLRQSWGIQPLPLDASGHLMTLQKHSMGAPALALLSEDLASSSRQLQSMHVQMGLLTAEQEPSSLPEVNVNAAGQYMQLMRTGRLPVRQMLTSVEELRILAKQAGPYSGVALPATVQETEEYPVITNWVQAKEKELARLTERRKVIAGELPIKAQGLSEVEKDVRNCLQKSFQKYTNGAVRDGLSDEAHDKVDEVLKEVKDKREKMEKWLLDGLRYEPKDRCAAGHTMRVAAGVMPAPAAPDLLRVLADRAWVGATNPYLTTATDALREGAVVWAQLCVLEDRLNRVKVALVAHSKGDVHAEVEAARELAVRREWTACEHPLWLVFEVENRLQIRQVQYRTAKHLMDHSGALAQLNVGEGKTRVILPMLALHWADRRDHVVRVTLLPTLLNEARDHLRRSISGGVLQRKVFVLPFHRDVKVDERVLGTLKAILMRCRDERGVLLMGQDARQSMLLKRVMLETGGGKTGSGSKSGSESQASSGCELGGGSEVESLKMLEGFPFHEILDECDELLRHNFKLVYAMGSHKDIPSASVRFSVPLAVLEVLSKELSSQELDGVRIHPAQPPPPGAFSGCRLSTGTPRGMRSKLAQEVATKLISKPPRNTSRMIAPKVTQRENLVQAVTNVSRGIDEILDGLNLDETAKDQVLLLRGLLGHGVAFHCLSLRVNVDFGVDRRGQKKRTKVAVPFRACDTPSDRSEFAHHDTAIFLTFLSYFNDGLSRFEMREAVSKLLSKGQSEQEAEYKEWLELAEGVVDEDIVDKTTWDKLDDVRSLDPSNEEIMDSLHKVFGRNMRTVGFWLQSCLLSREIQHYPRHIEATGWDLAHVPQGEGNHANRTSTIVGFSGTMDNKSLLPIQLTLKPVADNAAAATDGKMLHLLSKAEYVSVKADWEEVLSLAVSRRVHALIDAGALLAGSNSFQVAKALVEELKNVQDRDQGQRLDGVCFFDQKRGTWRILELDGRCDDVGWSAVAEHDTFVVFDEARCRGVDKRLRPDAKALLTLGPGMCRDKLVQAAGRMRQLDRGQRVLLAGTPEVEQRVRECRVQPGDGDAGEVSSKDVLEWVVRNTAASMERGILDWAQQGIQYARSRADPKQALLNDVVGLEKMYGRAVEEKNVPDALAERVKQARGFTYGEWDSVVSSIEEKGNGMGRGVKVLLTGRHDEQHERELATENQTQKEKEEQIPRMEPVEESDWEDYKIALSVTSAKDIEKLVGWTISLAELASWVTSSDVNLGTMPWPVGVFVTKNFVQCVQKSYDHDICMEIQFLQIPDALLLLSDGVVLLSEREANGVLQAQWEAAGQSTEGGSPKPSGAPRLLVNLRTLRRAMDDPDLPVPESAVALQPRPAGTRPAYEASKAWSAWLNAMGHLRAQGLLAAVQVWAGKTNFGSVLRRQALRRLVRGKKKEVQAILDGRGLGHMLARSDLETAADENIHIPIKDKSSGPVKAVQTEEQLLEAVDTGQVADLGGNEVELRTKVVAGSGKVVTVRNGMLRVRSPDIGKGRALQAWGGGDPTGGGNGGGDGYTLREGRLGFAEERESKRCP